VNCSVRRSWPSNPVLLKINICASCLIIITTSVCFLCKPAEKSGRRRDFYIYFSRHQISRRLPSPGSQSATLLCLLWNMRIINFSRMWTNIKCILAFLSSYIRGFDNHAPKNEGAIWKPTRTTLNVVMQLIFLLLPLMVYLIWWFEELPLAHCNVWSLNRMLPGV